MADVDGADVRLAKSIWTVGPQSVRIYMADPLWRTGWVPVACGAHERRVACNTRTVRQVDSDCARSSATLAWTPPRWLGHDTDHYRNGHFDVSVGRARYS